MGSVVPFSAYRRREAASALLPREGGAQIVILPVVRIVRAEPAPGEVSAASS